MLFYRRKYSKEYKSYLKNLGFKERYERFKFSRIVFKEKIPLFYHFLFILEKIGNKIKTPKYNLISKSDKTWDNKMMMWKIETTIFKNIVFQRYMLWESGKMNNKFRIKYKL